MIARHRFGRETTAIGRNGVVRCSGAEAQYLAWAVGPDVQLSPVTSRGERAMRADIRIPAEEVPGICKALLVVSAGRPDDAARAAMDGDIFWVEGAGAGERVAVIAPDEPAARAAGEARFGAVVRAESLGSLLARAAQLAAARDPIVAEAAGGALPPARAMEEAEPEPGEGRVP